MTHKDALIIASRELAKWGLVQVQTEICPRMIRTMGQAEFSPHGFPRRLKLGGRHVLESPDEEVIDTILHEIAHFLAGHKAGHGPAWKAACRKVGAKPVRCGPGVSPPFWVCCSVCWKTRVPYYGRPRKNLDRMLCRQCGRRSIGRLLFLTDEQLKQSIPREPVHREPVHREPVHREPVHREPVHREPVHREPVRQLNLFPGLEVQ